MSEEQLAKAVQPELLEEEKAQGRDQHGTRSISLVHEQFAGPLPHPSILAQYDQVVPGAAERIVRMAEEQAGHRRDLESTVIRNDVTNSRLGVVFGFIIGIVGISLPLFVKTTAATVVSISSLVALVGVFINGTNNRKTERKERRTEAGEEKE